MKCEHVKHKGLLEMLILCFLLFVLFIIGSLFLHHNIYYVALSVPLVMFIAGCMAYSVRNKMGSYFGYHTSAAERSADAWHFANTYCGQMMMKWSLPVLVVSELLIFIIQADRTVSEGIVFVQMVPFFMIMFQTERAINKNFDRHGNRYESL